MARRFWNSRRFIQATPLGGSTADRPVNPLVGFMYFDQTLNKPVWWDGTNWRTASNVIA
jgi:hypothetical protein